MGHYIDTETYARFGGEWKLVAFTESLIAPEPAIVKLDPNLCESYTGTYEANKDAMFIVTREGNKLFGQYAGEEKAQLLPVNKSRFSVRSDTAAYLFVRDKSDRVIAHIYRAEGVEVRYEKKLK